MLLLALSGSAVAGPYSDALGRKMVAETTPNEKVLLIRWFYMVVSTHPTLRGMSVITARQRDETDRAIGIMLTRLLTQSCAAEARDVIRYESTDGWAQAFSVFGSVAATEVFGGKEIQDSMMGGLKKYIDEKALIEALGPPR